MLSEINPHPRDKDLIFDEEPHIYTVVTDPDAQYTSCTTFIHQFFGHFDADAIIEKMMASKKWPESRYYGMTPDQIKGTWEINRVAASTAGTAMHKNIEDFYNGEKTLEDFKDLEDMQHFLTFYDQMGHDMTPYRSEWMIFDTDYKLAGSIDFVTQNNDGTISLWDWKRSREIKRDNRWQTGKAPVSHLPDCNYWHYSLQLNLYKALIEKNYDKQVSSLALVVMHPDNDSYIHIQVPDLQSEIQKLFRHRKRDLKRGHAAPFEPPATFLNGENPQEHDINSADADQFKPNPVCLL